MADANTDIILAAGDLNNPMRYLSLAKMAQDVQSQQRAIAGQNALRQLFSDPNALDPQGNLTPQAQAKVMQIDPATGMEFRKSALDDQVRRAQQQHEQTETGKIKFQAMGTIASVGVDAYNEAKKQGKSEQEALAAGAAARNEAAKANGGMLGEQDTAGIISQLFDPMKAEALARTNPEWVKQRGETEKERHDVATEQLGEEREDRLIAAIGAKGDPADKKWEVRKDNDGTEYRYNAENAKSTTLTGQPYTPKGGADKVGATPSGGTVSDDAADLIADEFLAGNRMSLTGMGRSPVNMTKISNVIAAKAKAQGLSGADISAKQAEFQGMMSGERTLSTRQVNMEIAANEVKNMAPLALQASEKVDRTKYPALNSIILAAEKGTGDEDVVRFGLAANSLIYTYAKFLNPTGIPTDADKAKATEILSTAWAKGQFAAAVDQIQKEIKSGQGAVKATKGELKEGETGKSDDSGDKPKVIKYDEKGNRIQ